MSNGILRVNGEKVVDKNGHSVILRGAGLGGWMNMENFITGYPGHEYQHREAILAVLGKEKQEYFFDKFLEYFFTEDDAKFFASLGLNCIRIPFNYRHFEDDMNPRVLKEEGFKHMDRVVDLCAKHNIYTILDMHTVPGGQSPDWHCDSGSTYAAFWDHKDLQDRTIWLWCEIAKRYKSNPWIAGYNPINEPCDPLHYRLPAFYDRFEPAIRAVDPDHILWLDGNTFAMEWKFFENVLPNCAYALHDYSQMGFPSGDRFKGNSDQLEKVEAQFLRKASFQKDHKVCAWNGEFGPVYANPHLDTDAAEINQERYNLLGAQLAVYDKQDPPISWSIWLYKDIGVQGMVYTSSDSFYMKTIAPFLAKKRALQIDCWGKYPSDQVSDVFDPLSAWIDKVCPEATNTYPTPWSTQRHLARRIMETFVAPAFSMEFANLFKGMSMEKLDEAAKSFRFDRCVQRDGLNKIMSEHAEGRKVVEAGLPA